MTSILNMKKLRHEEISSSNKRLLEVKSGKGWCTLTVSISILVMSVTAGSQLTAPPVSECRTIQA